MAEKKEKIIYISGHRNPDTDSICSAMALADLKNKISARQVADEHADRVVYKAVRAGHLNQETRYVMKEHRLKIYLMIKHRASAAIFP